jgi:hypothetical protein
MFADYIKILPIILSVTFVSCILLAIDNGIRSRAGQTKTFGTVSGYLTGGLVFGLIAILVFRWMEGQWAELAGQYYWWLAIGAAVLFSIAAVVFRFFFKQAPWYLWIAIHFLWALPYGWYLPRLLAK